MMTDGYSVPLPELTDWLQASLSRLDLPREDAAAVAEVLLDCELRGYEDHGVWMMRILYWGYRTEGGMNPTPAIRILKETPALTLLDGDRGCGVMACRMAMDKCIEKARSIGIAVAGVRRSGHFIAAAPYVLQAAEAGMIGFITSNTVPMIAPTGGLTPVFGSNPLAYGIPTTTGYPVILDMSTSATAMLKVHVAAHRGDEIPAGLVEDGEGNPVTHPKVDALRSLNVLPIGGAKGYGLAMVMDVLSGVLAGEVFGQDVAGGAPYGQFMWALDIQQFMPLDEFCERMDQLIAQVKSGKRKTDVDEILIPGERGLRRRERILSDGVVPLSPLTWQAMGEVCERLDLALPATDGGNG